jgi:hypothetical protein
MPFPTRVIEGLSLTIETLLELGVFAAPAKLTPALLALRWLVYVASSRARRGSANKQRDVSRQ